MDLTRVVVLDDYQDAAGDHADWASLPGCDVEFVHEPLPSGREVVARLADADVVVAMRERTAFPRDVLERLPRLRLLVTTGAKNAAIDVAAAAELGITVSGTESLPHPPAELTLALLLALARGVVPEDRALREGRWQTTLGFALAGQRLGVVGLGRIGGRVAELGSAFGMDVVAWSPNLTAERAAGVGATAVPKEELLRTSRFVTLHLKLGERSRGAIGAAELALMRPDAYLVNTARAGLVDTDALVLALEAGAIAGAGLDVFDDEPLPHDHPLLSVPNAVLLPHLGYVVEQGYDVYYGQAVEDIAAFLAGAPVRLLTPSG
jgi:phosphoglycerate dehydrogenase-like enzyme